MVSTRSSALLESSSSEEYEDAIQPDDIEGEIVFASDNSEPGSAQQQPLDEEEGWLEVTVEDLSNGNSETYCGSLVIAADGYNSAVGLFLFCC